MAAEVYYHNVCLVDIDLAPQSIFVGLVLHLLPTLGNVECGFTLTNPASSPFTHDNKKGSELWSPVARNLQLVFFIIGADTDTLLERNIV